MNRFKGVQNWQLFASFVGFGGSGIFILILSASLDWFQAFRWFAASLGIGLGAVFVLVLVSTYDIRQEEDKKQLELTETRKDEERTKRMQVRLEILRQAAAIDIHATTIEKLEERISDAELKLANELKDIGDDKE